MEICRDRSPSNYYCTREAGHRGCHVSTSACGIILDAWEDTEKIIARDKSRYQDGYSSGKYDAEAEHELDGSDKYHTSSYYWDGYKAGKESVEPETKHDIGFSLVSGWECPRCKQVNSPLAAHCDCREDD